MWRFSLLGAASTVARIVRSLDDNLFFGTRLAEVSVPDPTRYGSATPLSPSDMKLEFSNGCLSTSCMT